MRQSSSSLSGQSWNSESLGGNLERHGTPVFESKISLRLHREMNRIWLASPFSRVLFLADFYADMLDIQRA